MNKNFTKADLKVGYVVKLRSGELRMNMPVYSGFFCLVNQQGTSLASYDDNLKNTVDDGWDVMEVYGYSISAYSARKISTDDRKLLWKREEAKKMTVSEIEKELGYKVEVVAEEVK